MPIQRCKLPDGGDGYQWGDSGRCYRDRADAERQAAAAHASGFTGDTFALDRASVREIDQDGHLHVAESPISKACVNPYKGREIPGWQELGLDPDRIYRLLRDPAELEKSAASFNGKPLLNLHRPQTADDHDKGLTVGAVNNVRWEAPYLMGRLDVWDGDAIDGIKSGEQRQLSSAYRYRPDMTPGAFGGEPYDGVMRDIAGNHVALVEKGRAGADVVVGDQALFSLDAEWNESQHKRSDDGKFGSGGSSHRNEEPESEQSDFAKRLIIQASSARKTGNQSVSKTNPINGASKIQDSPQAIKGSSASVSSTHPFVQEFIKKNPTGAQQAAHLKTVPTEKLHTALKLLESGDESPSTNMVRNAIKKEIGSRGPTSHDQALKTMEITPMATASRRLSPRAAAAFGALTAHLAPRLAQDAKLDVTPALSGVTSKTWKSDKPRIVAAVTRAASGKLAADAEIGDLVQLLDKLDGLEPDGDEGAAPVARDGDAAAQIKAILGESASPEVVAKLAALIGKPATDAAPAKPGVEGAAEPPIDKPAKDERDEGVAQGKNDGDPDVNKEGVTAAAMDAAIKAAVTGANAALTARLQALTDAQEAVRPILGSVRVNVAQDSAATVYRMALDHLKTEGHAINLDGVPDSALGAVLAAIAPTVQAAARRPSAPSVHLAADAASEAGFAARFTGAKLARTI